MSVLPAPRSPRPELPQLCSAASGPRTTPSQRLLCITVEQVERKQRHVPSSWLPASHLSCSRGQTVCSGTSLLGRDPVAVPEMARLGGVRCLGYRSWPRWELTPSPMWISAGPLGGTPCGLASPRGRGLYCQERRGPLPGFEKVFEAWRPRRAPRPCSLSPPGSPTCSFNMGGGWIKCLGRTQQPESFLAEDGECALGSHSRCKDGDLGRIKEREWEN